jgi:hypothetical protein
MLQLLMVAVMLFASCRLMPTCVQLVPQAFCGIEGGPGSNFMRIGSCMPSPIVETWE